MVSAKAVARALLLLFVVQIGFVWASDALGMRSSLNAWWPREAVLVFATVSTLASLALCLPWQAVLLSGSLIAALGAAVEIAAVGQLFSIGQLWPALLVWIVVILNCRGVARPILGLWPTLPSYGFWLLGTTILLVVPLIVSFASFGPVMLPYFSEALGSMRLDWQTTKALLGCTGATFIILLIVTPSLINKKPAPQPTGWHPLIVWGGFNLWFLTVALRERVWPGGSLLLTEIAVVGLLARRAAMGPSR